jgi:hypothetical protein
MKKWFEGKDVALVGNAESLTKTQYGPKIDSHQVVVRLNKSYRMLPPRTNEFTKSHGTRIDVLFINLMRTAGLRQRPTPETKIAQVTHCEPHPKFKDITDFFIPKEINVPLMELCPILKSGQKAKPSVGIRVMNYISNYCEPKSITVYGFDWKKTPSYWGQNPVMLTMEHDFAFEQQYWQDHFLSKPNVKLKQ